MTISMSSSMKDYCKVVAPFMPSTLVNSEALSRIYDITQSLTPFFTVFLECRLAEKEPRVDFLADVRHGTLSIPEKFLKQPLWQDIENLYKDWSEPTSFLHKTIYNLCLEFDLETDHQTSDIVVPCVFFGLNQEAMGEANILTTILTNLPSRLLKNLPNTKQFDLNLQKCIDKLPKGALIAHLGIMLSRSTKEVRLHIKGIPALQIPAYLKQIGWQGKTDQISDLIETLASFVDYLTLDLDIGDQIGFQIGLECYFNNQPPNESRWYSFLEYLVAKGLCTSSKKDALLTWPGIIKKNDCPEIWPSSLLIEDVLLNSIALGIFYRRIYHVKIVYHPDKPLVAKAYLQFGHKWIDNDLIKNT